MFSLQYGGQTSSTYHVSPLLMETLAERCAISLPTLFAVVGNQPLQNFSQILDNLQQCQQTLAEQSQIPLREEVTRLTGELTAQEQTQLLEQTVRYTTNGQGQSIVIYTQPRPNSDLTQARTDLDGLVAFLLEGQRASELLTILPAS